MGLSFDSSIQTICLILNIIIIVLSIILYQVEYFENKRIIVIFTFLWALIMLLFYYIKKNQLESTYTNMFYKTKEEQDEADNIYRNHRELYFHLSLVSVYIMFIVLGFYLFRKK